MAKQVDLTAKKTAKTGGGKKVGQGGRKANLLQREVVKDPLADVPYGNGIEKDSEAELSALLAGFKDRAKQEADRFRLATDSEYWFAVCFASREQKERFLQVMDWIKYGDKYLDGTVLAEKHNIELPEVYLSNRQVRQDKKLHQLVEDDE